MNPIRIFITDDHTLVRDGLKAVIERQPDMEVVGESSKSPEALKQIQDLAPDVALVDLAMPDMDGVVLTEHLSHTAPDVKVLVLSAFEDDFHVRRALKAGAAGYIAKRSASEMLIDALHAVVEGKIYMDPVIAGAMMKNVLQATLATDEPMERSVLSNREEEVLRLIAWGYSNKEIAAKLHLSTKTIETHKARVMNKLNVHSRVDLVRYAVHHGWLDEPDSHLSP